ncbi:MAG: cytochrome c-type biogenesis protein CcmH [Candidatus Rokubacteria bacterium]|nr:cytochrome c-type biogenesis protein CcmH [Candidatus Rokubacteria bacterium]
MRPAALASSLTLVVLLAGIARAAPVSEEAVTRIAGQLRCVVCQNLSVADSPSEMARQMREVIRERLARGETDEQILKYFEERYGAWIRLSPGGWLVWVLPFAGLFGGLGVVLLVTLRWSRRARLAEEEAPSPADRERVRIELERLNE